MFSKVPIFQLIFKILLKYKFTDKNFFQESFYHFIDIICLRNILSFQTNNERCLFIFKAEPSRGGQELSEQ